MPTGWTKFSDNAKGAMPRRSAARCPPLADIRYTL